MTTLLMLSLLPWLLVLCHQISRRGLAVLLLWLLISPVATNLISRPGANPLFRLPAEHSQTYKATRHGGYFGPENDIRLNQLLEPTRTLFIAFFAVFCLNTIVKRRQLGPFDRTEIWMGVFSVILLGGVLLMSNVLHYSVRVASDAFIVAFTAYFISRRYVRTEEQLRQLVRVICWVGFTIIVICIVERLLHGGVTYRLAGPFRNPGIVFTVVMVAFFLALLDTVHAVGLSDGRYALHPVIRKSLLFMAPLIILLTWARSNYIGFLAGIGMFIFLGRRLAGRSQRIGTIALVLIVLLVTGLAAGLAPNEKISNRLGDPGTIYGRFATWKIAFEEGISHPVFGIGLNNSRDALAANVAEVGGVKSWISVHNSFLRIFAEHGFTGLFAYLAIVGSIIRMGLNLYRTGVYLRDRWRGVAVTAVMVAYLTPSLFASLLHEPYPMQTIFVYAFVGAISGIYSQPSSSRLYTTRTSTQDSASFQRDRTTALTS